MTGDITISIITLVSLVINAITIYKWVSDYLRREQLNDQAFHMLVGLAQSVSKRVSMIVKRTNILNEQDKPNVESMIFLENMWADSMSTIDNLLAAAKALKPTSVNTLPKDSTDLLKMNALNNRAPGNESKLT
jgi:hypothetical protein